MEEIREDLPPDAVRREPLPGLDSSELHQSEADEHSRLAREAASRGDIGGNIVHSLAAVRAIQRRDGNTEIKLEEPEFDDSLRDRINQVNRIDLGE